VPRGRTCRRRGATAPSAVGIVTNVIAIV
jgi:hypothetical protein